jgi:hypothetical protein
MNSTANREAFEAWWVKFYQEPLPPEWRIATEWECWKAASQRTEQQASPVTAAREQEAAKEADAVDALTEMGWIWDGDQWQKPVMASATGAEPMRKHVEDFAAGCGWKREDGEGAFEFVQRTSYRQGWQDGRRESMGDVHRDTPEVATPTTSTTGKVDASRVRDEALEEAAQLYGEGEVAAPVGNSAWGEAYQEGWIAGAQAYRDAIRSAYQGKEGGGG